MTKTLEEFNFFEPQTLECPFEFYQRLREEAPIYQLPGTGIFMVSRMEDIRALLKDTDTFSSNFAHMLANEEPCAEAKAIFAQEMELADTLLTLDPPRHKVYRSLVNKVFSAKRVEQMSDYMSQIIDDLIDNFIDQSECEFIAQFASPLPLLVIADQLGIPRCDLARFKAWSDALAARLGHMASDEEEIRIANFVIEYQQYMLKVIHERREQPRDDMISDLVTTHIDDGRAMNDSEVLSMVQQFLVAGNETTTSALAGGLLSLIQRDDQMQLLRADPARIDNAVEEILRLETPSAGLWRVATRDIELHGVQIPKDAMVMLRYASANRDESTFDVPEMMDVCRANAKDHIAFGQGTHFCPGAMLSRKEMILSFNRLFERLDNIRLAEGKNDLMHWPNVVLRGLKALHITFDAR